MAVWYAVGVGGRAAGGAAGLRLWSLGVDMRNKRNRTTATGGCGGILSLAKLKTRVKS